VGDVVSLIMATYNRASTLPRAIDSVLAQDYPDWELIVVDDGSTDDTAAVLAAYSDPRIRVLCHQHNRGLMAAKNTGLDDIRGEWFTFLDSDDAIVPGALSALMAVVARDPTITAITCNCVSSETGQFTGRGLSEDRYLDFATMIQRCKGEYWGITRTELLGDLRLNETVPSGAFARLWWPISEKANRFYLHQGLRTYYTAGGDRVTRSAKDVDRRIRYYRAQQDESYVLGVMKRYLPQRYSEEVFHLGMVAALDGRTTDALHDLAEYWPTGPAARRALLVSCIVLGRRWSRFAYSAAHQLSRG
jgi:glycosyltransferase involved in cell wall biosynthesis